MNKSKTEAIYKQVDEERIRRALDQGNRYDANILFKYSSLSRMEYDELIKNHPKFKEKEWKFSPFWKTVLDRLSIEVSPPSFNTWLKNLEAVRNGDKLIVYCDNEFQRDWLENQYRNLIETIATNIAEAEIKAEFELKPD